MKLHTTPRPRRTLAGLLAVGIAAASVLLSATSASAATTVLAPSSITSTKGTVASGGVVGNLAVQDQSGTQDTFSKYVEFDTVSTGYAGYRQYTVPSSITPSSVTSIAVSANYRGPSNAEQAWTWSLYNWATSAWTTLGTNSGATSWTWKTFTFASPSSAASYVSSAGLVRVQLSAANGVDNALLDYEAITVVSGSTPPADTTAPSVPTGLNSPSKTSTSVNLAWTASTDNVGVTGYDVYRGTTLVGTVAGTSTTVTGLTANTAYSFTVRARDAAGNVSAASTALPVTTSAAAGDTTAPSVPGGLNSPSKTATSVSLAWTASTDNVGVTGYEVFVNGSATPAASPTTTSATISGLTASTAYTFTVKARDAAGNRSAATAGLPVTTSASGGTSVTLPPANGKWDYQIGGPYTPAAGVLVVSRDRTVAPAAGKYNICYNNVGQTQPDEGTPNASIYGTTAWWLANHPNVILKGSNGQPIIDPNWNEVVFDVRTAAQRTELASVIQPWFLQCKNDGYNAIEPDNIDLEVRSSGLETHAQVREYLKLLVTYAHSIGLAIGQKNAVTDDNDNPEWQTDGPTFNGGTGFDFAIAEECGAFTECGTFTAMYPGRVYVVEYATAGWNAACSAVGATNSVIQRNVDVRPSGSSGYVYKEC
jgi:chitodextrinase